jgi:tetratricopeptide (TPR) repeat protein
MASSARIDELKKKFDENPRRYFAPLANEYRKAGELEQAIALCRAYLPQQPGHMSGHIVFGQALFEAGQHEEARSVFETALTLDPENLIALRHLGDIAHAAGDPASARAWYARVLDADPRNEEIATLLQQLDAAGAPAAESSASGSESGGWGAINPSSEHPAVDEAAAAPMAVSEELTPLDLGDPVRNADVAEGTDAAAPTTMDFAPTAEQGGAPLMDLSEMQLDTPATDAGREASPSAASEIDALFEAESSSPAPTAEAPAAAAQPSSDLGLEPMEFVPPPREAARPAAAEGEDFLGGRMLSEGPGDASSATPAAFVTETMAELYLQQGFHDEALQVYRQLLAQSPTDDALRERVEQLERGSRSSVSMASISDEVIESARRRQATHTPRSMRAFLASLAIRRAPRRAPEGASAPAAQRPDESAPAADDAPAEEDSGAGAHAMTGLPDYDLEAAEAAPAGAQAEEDRDHGALAGLPTLDADVADAPAPPREPTPRNGDIAASPVAGGTLDALFGGAVVNGDDEAAASALAHAFAPTRPAGGADIRGRPTRAAKTELSLDHVFRESGGRPSSSSARNSFSFDQFFSDASTASGEEHPATGESSDAAASDDIEQFNAWLEGLKKK